MKKLFLVMAVLMAVLLMLTFAVLPIFAEEAEAPPLPEEMAEADAKPEWQVLVEEKVIPYAIFGFTCIGTVYIAISPVLARMRRASDKYSTSADGVNTVSASSKESTAEVKALRQEIAELKKELCDRSEQDHALLQAGVKIMALAFSHESELVKNGTASAIMKLAGEEAEDGDGE